MSNLNDGVLELARPEIIGALPNFPGSENNLLPRALLFDPLKVAIPTWQELESPAFLTLWLGWNGQTLPVTEYYFEPPINPGLFPYTAEIAPQLFSQEGEYEVHYKLDIGGNEYVSHLNTFTVDRTPPNLGNPGPLPLFPQDLIDRTITPEYLAAHNDEVEVTIARYLGQRPCDVITFYFGAATENNGLQISVHDSASDTVFKLKGDIIRAKGDGDHFAFYSLNDRAGNEGRNSRYQPIRVSGM
ncbi:MULTISPECIES: hypothetical protein [unclassified Pseudomonas]|jgi:hypothetical protein|uniref:hypothetical protein n=1 Tax=unclassified Pseudomonas TaxID=196821 RepID=UPI001C459F0F|nr:MULTISPECIES: hypothetical protein [unclassified Pseudomonas]MBV7515536.1 hypothetical protein [Pseudomonas sp. PDM25]